MLFAAGEKVPETRFRWIHVFRANYSVDVPYFLQRLSEPSLRLTEIYRHKIRKHLMVLSNVNLFVQVTKLGLPVSLESFLVYNVSIDDKPVEEIQTPRLM